MQKSLLIITAIWAFCGVGLVSCGEDRSSKVGKFEPDMIILVEASLPDFVRRLSDDSENPQFKRAMQDALAKSEGNDDFVDQFLVACAKHNAPLGIIFSYGPDDDFDRDMSNERVIDLIRAKFPGAVSRAAKIVGNRLTSSYTYRSKVEIKQGGRIEVKVDGHFDKQRIRNLVQAGAELEFWETYPLHELDIYLEQANLAASEILYPGFRDSVIYTRELREGGLDSTYVVDTLGHDSAYQAYLDRKDNMLSPEDLVKMDPIFVLLQRNLVQDGYDGQLKWGVGAVLGIASISDTAALNSIFSNPIVRAVLPRNLKLMWGAKALPDISREPTNRIELFALQGSDEFGLGGPVLTGEAVEDARPDFSESTGQAIVLVTMTSRGSAQWESVTAKAAANNNSAIAITLDDHVFSAPPCARSHKRWRNIYFRNFHHRRDERICHNAEGFIFARQTQNCGRNNCRSSTGK